MVQQNNFMYLTHFMRLFSVYTIQKHQKISEGTERDQCHEMG